MCRPTFWLGRIDNQAAKVADEMVESLKNNTWTKQLYIDGIGWRGKQIRQDTALRIVRGLSKNTSVSSFLFQNADMQDENDLESALTETFAQNTSLKTIKLRNLKANGGERSSRYYNIPESVFASRNVEKLHLNKVALNQEACASLGRLIRESASLTTLDMDSVDITDAQGWMHIMAALAASCSLKSLMLSNMNLVASTTPNLLAQILSSLSKNQSITDLAMDGMDLTADHAGDIATFLRRNKFVKDLSLRRNQLNGNAVRCLLETGVSESKTLQALRLSWNPLGDEGAEFVSQYLQGSSCRLQELCLVSTKMGDEGCHAIAKALKLNTSLEVLAMDGNAAFKRSCGSEILDSLQRNMHLKSILEQMPSKDHLQDNDKTREWEQIEFLLRANQAHRRELFEDMDSPSSTTQAVLPHMLACASQQSDVLFHFLSNSAPHHFLRPLSTPATTEHSSGCETKNVVSMAASKSLTDNDNQVQRPTFHHQHIRLFFPPSA